MTGWESLWMFLGSSVGGTCIAGLANYYVKRRASKDLKEENVVKAGSAERLSEIATWGSMVQVYEKALADARAEMWQNKKDEQTFRDKIEEKMDRMERDTAVTISRMEREAMRMLSYISTLMGDFKQIYTRLEYCDLVLLDKIPGWKVQAFPRHETIPSFLDPVPSQRVDPPKAA